ncbi:4'-phosphopantetheinyl transferase superfamily protein [Bradyrhizobium neotropicale]|uniref:4'-phosphopantetheinyl transferase family protein n=1 Tax=Bradyrhizobium neotropicale TaxID=1497615 RepID=UPI001AD790CF|nr:4'-phosphopantetheinyl transferase superfamily protein [Bradyrhizobium neotropicale]MBO4221042.1 4'-phosphopantetheinyl transferase superfamily protein [Bradyrhizobium neotropicale]
MADVTQPCMNNAVCTGQDGFASSLTALQATTVVAWAIAVKRVTPEDDELRLRWLPHPKLATPVKGPTPGEIAFWLAAVFPPEKGATPGPTALPLEQSAALLDVQETDHLARLRHHEDRRSYLAAHAGARLILGHAVGRPPNALRFAPSANGKPVLLVDPQEIDFSLSHARGAVAVAAARMPIGVDVEPLREVDHLDSISELVLAAEEQAALRNAPEISRSRLFLRYWTLKEALLKAAGLGFAVPPNEVIVDAGPSPTVLAVPPALGSVAQWHLLASADF